MAAGANTGDVAVDELLGLDRREGLLQVLFKDSLR